MEIVRHSVFASPTFRSEELPNWLPTAITATHGVPFFQFLNFRETLDLQATKLVSISKNSANRVEGFN